MNAVLLIVVVWIPADTGAEAVMASGPFAVGKKAPFGPHHEVSHMPHNKAVFRLIMIKPTHYDNDGYPIQWLRAAIPSNTLACLNGLAEDCRRRKVLGPDVELVLSTYDETNQRVCPARIIQSHLGEKMFVALVGVQSNQFPRAM